MSVFTENGIKTRIIAGREIPEKILLENGIAFTEREIKERDQARRYLPENKLCEIAGQIAANITIRIDRGGYSEDFRRESTPAEYDIIYKIALSALLALNHGETARQSRIAEDAIINAAEYTIDTLIMGVNGYDTIYQPLRKAVQSWRDLG